MMKLSPLVKVPLRYGAIAGVLGSAIIAALYYIGKHPLLFPPHFDFRIILFGVFMFFTLKEYRDFYKNGIMSFWEGLIMCVIMVTVFAIFTSIFIYFFGRLEVQFVKSFIILYTEQVKSFPKEVIESLGKDNVARDLEALKGIGSFELAKKYISQSYIISFFLTIILSIILRRQPKY